MPKKPNISRKFKKIITDSFPLIPLVDIKG
jgi:hypothetical protein